MAATGNGKHVLITGGAGFIGSHTIVCLVQSGYDVTVVDNLINSSKESLNRVREITGCREEQIRFFEVDICNYDAMREVFAGSPKFDACIHFAGLKVASALNTLNIYDYNVIRPWESQ